MHELYRSEQWWRDHHEWLYTLGYLLRPRYHPGWTAPSGREEELKRPGWVMDAVRACDGVAVALKRVPYATASEEERFMRRLTSDPLVSHPDNPCPPLYQVLGVPDEDDVAVFVLPYLRQFDSPPFETIGEVMDFCRQALRGLRFLHEHHIAHRDPHSKNIMLDPRHMYPTGFYTGNARYAHRTPGFAARAQVFTRTQRPSKYYWIDYGLAPNTRLRRAGPAAANDLVPYVRGGDKSIPETQEGSTEANPFKVDVYVMGNLIRKHLVEVGCGPFSILRLSTAFQRYSGLQSLNPLVASMCQDRPQDRPTMATATRRLDDILTQLSFLRLRSLTVRRKDLMWRFLQGLPPYIAHTVLYLLRGVPALPLVSEEDVGQLN
ncbi:hypothetical protein B0H10DRAFT_1829799 [Mycena sp. CBHHK59/15]|nr:hypothetical protein B0H10DRAFT_1829799 [Mycena sp. CBHHK59/15]